MRPRIPILFPSTPTMALIVLMVAGCGDGSPDRLTDAGDDGHDGPSAPAPDALTPSGPWSPFEGSLLTLETFPVVQMVSGAAKDAIPALTNPGFVEPSEIDYLRDDDLILGIAFDGEARAYPHNIAWWHEIVNDVIAGRTLAVTFCPLTGTGLVFEAQPADEVELELGVSGLLWNNNLVMYDRRDDTTLYPQMYFTGVTGPRRGESLRLLPVVQTKWSTWRLLYPDTQVIAKNTFFRFGHSYPYRDYTRYPYGDYRSNHDLLFYELQPSIDQNVNAAAESMPMKERVLGLRLGGEARAYPLTSMASRMIINDRVGGVEVAIVRDAATDLTLCYTRTVDGRVLTLRVDSSSAFPFGLRDDESGTAWDIKGLAIDGPLQGARLTPVPAHQAMWFAWVTFWPTTSVWQP